MHSRIFQVGLEPISKENYIEESNYYDHWFTTTFADYVSDDCDRKEDIKWLQDCYGTKGIEFGTDDNGEYFIVKSKQTYFEDSFKEFTKLVHEITEYTLDDFAHGMYEVGLLRRAYEDKYSFYVDEDEELMTFDSFVRLCEMEEKYYIGGTVDYHL